jgi:hypothetical protein
MTALELAVVGFLVAQNGFGGGFGGGDGAGVGRGRPAPASRLRAVT